MRTKSRRCGCDNISVGWNLFDLGLKVEQKGAPLVGNQDPNAIDMSNVEILTPSQKAASPSFDQKLKAVLADRNLAADIRIILPGSGMDAQLVDALYPLVNSPAMAQTSRMMVDELNKRAAQNAVSKEMLLKYSTQTAPTSSGLTPEQLALNSQANRNASTPSSSGLTPEQLALNSQANRNASTPSSSGLTPEQLALNSQANRNAQIQTSLPTRTTTMLDDIMSKLPTVNEVISKYESMPTGLTAEALWTQITALLQNYFGKIPTPVRFVRENPGIGSLLKTLPELDQTELISRMLKQYPSNDSLAGLWG